MLGCGDSEGILINSVNLTLPIKDLISEVISFNKF